MSTTTASEWWALGTVTEVTVAGTRRRVFVRDEGDGPCITLLHGYPASSLEWSGIWPALTAGHRVVAFDFLGFGASDKPAGYRYPLDDQAELVEAVWRQIGVSSSAVVAYDYGAIVAQILQTRRSAITRLTYLNASLYPELYRPRPIQRLAPLPLLGALVWKRYDERAFHRSLATVFGPDHPLSVEQAHEHGVALTRDDPKATSTRALLSYIRQRANRAAELAATVDGVTPTRFVWGMADPVSGHHIAEALHARLTAPDVVELDGVGHAPHLEVPDQVASAILQQA